MALIEMENIHKSNIMKGIEKSGYAAPKKKLQAQMVSQENSRVPFFFFNRSLLEYNCFTILC